MQVYKSTRHLMLALAAASLMGLGGAALAQGQSASNEFMQPSADGIAAVVNNEVITLRMLQAEMDVIKKNLVAQKIPTPDVDVLQNQVLQRLIDERLLYQEAAQLRINAAEINIEQAAESIAQRNNMTLVQLRKEIEKSGMDWKYYLKGLRQEILMDQIRQRVIDPRINISNTEIDIYLKNQGIDPKGGISATPSAANANEVIELAQILVRIPEGASQAEQAEQKRKAENLLQQLRQGADFSGLAAASSDGAEALQGGNMGARPLGGWPDVFAQAVQGTAAGGVSELVRSGAGYHILKVVNRAQSPVVSDAEQDMIITQTKARHILIKLDEITSEEKGKERIFFLLERLRNNESFEMLAQANSDDSSAPQGGDLGWLSPGETVPAFEKVMDSLAPGEISEPVLSQFGWHIIRVDERRQRNVGIEYYRMQARRALHEQRIEPAFDDWFSQIRSQAFIDNRLAKMR